MTDLLHMQAVTCRFGDRAALDRVDFNVGRGQRVALLGANGAGKSTLMRAIAGRVPLDEGTIAIDGHAVGTAKARALIGVIPQTLALFPRLSARENLRAFAEFSGLTGAGAREAVERSLAWAELVDRGDEAVARLSGGMQRRLSIACGAVHAPALLLADEPLVGVDAQRRAPIERLLDELCAQGTTLIESTHDLGHVVERFDSIAVMARGRIVASGAPGALLGRVANLAHHCRITLGEAPPDLALPAGFERSGRQLSGTLRDVSVELGRILDELHDASLVVRDVQVHPPGIEAVIERLDGSAS
jgi:ABC-2 type transport system ATP-binding protein